MASVQFFPLPYINGRNVTRATQNKSIFLLMRTCGRAVNWILKHGIYFKCSWWKKLQALQRDQSLAAVTILRNQRGQLPV